jgi:hypothetical protein
MIFRASTNRTTFSLRNKLQLEFQLKKVSQLMSMSNWKHLLKLSDLVCGSKRLFERLSIIQRHLAQSIISFRVWYKGLSDSTYFILYSTILCSQNAEPCR